MTRPELVRSPALSRHLLEFAGAASADEAARARSVFHRRLNEEQAAES